MATPLSPLCRLGGRRLVGFGRADLSQQLVGLHFLSQGFVQQGCSLRHAELIGPRDERSVARDLVMFDRLSSRDQASIDRNAFAKIFDRFLPFRDDAIDGFAGLGLSPLA